MSDCLIHLLSPSVQQELFVEYVASLQDTKTDTI